MGRLRWIARTLPAHHRLTLFANRKFFRLKLLHIVNEGIGDGMVPSDYLQLMCGGCCGCREQRPSWLISLIGGGSARHVKIMTFFRVRYIVPNQVKC